MKTLAPEKHIQIMHNKCHETILESSLINILNERNFVCFLQAETQRK